MSVNPNTNFALESGNLICQSSGLTKPYRINILSPEHLDDVIKVQQQVLGTLEKPSSYYPGAHQIFEESLSGRGLIVGCYVEDSLIGFRSIWYPQNVCRTLHCKTKDQNLLQMHADWSLAVSNMNLYSHCIKEK